MIVILPRGPDGDARFYQFGDAEVTEDKDGYFTAKCYEHQTVSRHPGIALAYLLEKLAAMVKEQVKDGAWEEMFQPKAAVPTTKFDELFVTTAAERTAAPPPAQRDFPSRDYSTGYGGREDRVVEGCSDCKPGHPCYGHGH